MIEEKRRLRKQMREMRRACPDRAMLDGKITAHFMQSEIYQKAEQLLLYCSFDAEADTYALLAAALADGKEVYLPRCVPGTNRMHFYRVFSVDELQADAFGIPAPAKNAERLFTAGKNAVCVVPGLAFSKEGDRLGYGRGYYDTFLEKIDVCTVGLCYSFQITEHVPTEQHDKRMRYICTENGIFACAEKHFYMKGSAKYER